MNRLFFIAVAGLALFSSSLASAQSNLQWTTNYYSITGATLSEIHQSLRNTRPWKDRSSHDGLTQWKVDWQFRLGRVPAGCRVESFTVRTAIACTLPRWIAPSNATPAVREAWTSYLSALQVHEAGHAQFALAAAAELHRRVHALKESSDCFGLRTSIDEIGRLVLEEHRNREKDYDRLTNHGATQGARLPGRMRPRR